MTKYHQILKKRQNEKKDFSDEDIERGKANWDVTNKVYKQTCEELGYSNESLKNEHKRLMSSTVIDIADEFEAIKEKGKKLDDLYCQKIRELSTTQLEETIAIYDIGLIKRTRKTIVMIRDELANRAIMGDKT